MRKENIIAALLVEYLFFMMLYTLFKWGGIEFPILLSLWVGISAAIVWIQG